MFKGLSDESFEVVLKATRNLFVLRCRIVLKRSASVGHTGCPCSRGLKASKADSFCRCLVAFKRAHQLRDTSFLARRGLLFDLVIGLVDALIVGVFGIE